MTTSDFRGTSGSEEQQLSGKKAKETFKNLKSKHAKNVFLMQIHYEISLSHQMN